MSARISGGPDVIGGPPGAISIRALTRAHAARRLADDRFEAASEQL
jgi:hypothetical protein